MASTTEQRAGPAQPGPKLGQVGPVSAPELHGADGQDSGSRIAQAEEAPGIDPSLTGAVQTQLDAARFEAHPGINVGRIFAVDGDDIVPLAPVEAGGYQAQPGGRVFGEGDALGPDREQLADAGPDLTPKPLPMRQVEWLLGEAVDEDRHR